VKWCLENGGEVNATTDLGCTPLHLAYLRNDKNIKKLLKNGIMFLLNLQLNVVAEGHADPNMVNCYGLKPKDYAHSRKALVRPLPKTACSVEVIIDGYNQPFCLEIWFAARIGWLEVVKLYIEQLGCDVDVRYASLMNVF
jgi:ankyrin repeat protein